MNHAGWEGFEILVWNRLVCPAATCEQMHHFSPQFSYVEFSMLGPPTPPPRPNPGSELGSSRHEACRASDLLEALAELLLVHDLYVFVHVVLEVKAFLAILAVVSETRRKIQQSIVAPSTEGRKTQLHSLCCTSRKQRATLMILGRHVWRIQRNPVLRYGKHKCTRHA